MTVQFANPTFTPTSGTSAPTPSVVRNYKRTRNGRFKGGTLRKVLYAVALMIAVYSIANNLLATFDLKPIYYFSIEF